MSEFISGEDAKLAWAKGEKVQWRQSFDWNDLGTMNILGIFDDEDIEFRLKPRTVNLNGVEVGQLRTAMWCINCPKEVTLEFGTEDDAHHFYANALKIFNGV